MKLALPKFQFRFMRAAGNVIFPGNFHPIGTQRDAELMVGRAVEHPISRPERADEPGADGLWLIVGGTGGFGSAARVALAVDHEADTINVSYDAAPNPESSNKVRKIGSPAWHRNVAIERELRKLGRTAVSYSADAFDPLARAMVIENIHARFPGRKLAGLVWALAAPRGLDPRTGKTVSSMLKPLGKPATIKTFSGPEGDQPPQIFELEIEQGTPEEAVATSWVMGGRVVEDWVQDLLEADLLDVGHTLLTISYRGSSLNAPLYRDGLIGLAKADLEFTTRALSSSLFRHVEGRAFAVEGPAVVTEASGGIPGVPLYMALLLDVMGELHEDPLASMRRMFHEHFMGTEPKPDEAGLIRMDDRELSDAIQSELAKRFAALDVGDNLDRDLYDRFMAAYARTRGFEVEGVDYQAEFDTDEVCEVEQDR
jgi:enoyl-[acyl-carrier protein] reductase / trans-2-enoyl-CoA reductase (NAD+)